MKEPLHIRVKKEMPDFMPCKHAGEPCYASRRFARLCHRRIDENNQRDSGFKGILPYATGRLISVISEFDIHQDAVFEGEIADKLQ